MRKTICVGIVAYDGLDGQVAEDYMRMMFHLGRRCPDYNFQLALKWKSEQFRARTAIANAALQWGADYIWMLDDDHIVDIGKHQASTHAYDLPIKLVEHLEQNPKIGIVGALYYQRGADCYPVIMQERENGLPFFLHKSEVSHRMQKVDVTGGGCMMIRSEIFHKIDAPWFEPEHDFGTDIQLCKQARAAGYEVWCDTSLQIGHLQNEKRLITSDVSNSLLVSGRKEEPDTPLSLFRKDAEEYLGVPYAGIVDLAASYSKDDFDDFEDKREYYARKGDEQLGRQVWFHHLEGTQHQMQILTSMLDKTQQLYGCDYGCGSAPIGFDLALNGHKMDFVDIDGSGAYEFTKWRAEKYGLECGWSLNGPYDYVLMLDSLEHLQDWRSELGEIVDRIKLGGGLLTNYFTLADDENKEHISMDREAVKRFLIDKGMYQANSFLWAKSMEKEEVA